MGRAVLNECSLEGGESAAPSTRCVTPCSCSRARIGEKERKSLEDFECQVLSLAKRGKSRLRKRHQYKNGSVQLDFSAAMYTVDTDKNSEQTLYIFLF